MTDFLAANFPTKGWFPIGSWSDVSSVVFYGNFDGAGYSVNGLWINRPTLPFVGLFSEVRQGEIKNLSVNIDASKGVRGGNMGAGGLIGCINGATVTNCNVTGGGVFGEPTSKVRAGGLIGTASFSVIRNCYATSDVYGNEYVGGLCGFATETAIENCYATGNVEGEIYAGGLAGFSYADDVSEGVVNCYASGKVSGKHCCGIVGYGFCITNCIALNASIEGTVSGTKNMGRVNGYDDISIELSNNYALSNMRVYDQTTGTDVTLRKGADKKDGADISVSESLNKDTYTNRLGWNFTSVWYMESGKYPVLRYQVFGYGSGSIDDPYLIRTPQQLDNIRNFLGAAYKDTYWKLACDIDLSSYLTSGEGWSPIGGSEAFYGHLDGDGHVIKGLWMNKTNTEYVGLFSRLAANSEVKNLGIIIADGKEVLGKNYVGALAGAQYGNITNVYCIGK